MFKSGSRELVAHRTICVGGLMFSIFSLGISVVITEGIMSKFRFHLTPMHVFLNNEEHDVF